MLHREIVGRRPRLSLSVLVAGAVAAMSVAVAFGAPAPPVKINPIFTYNKADRTAHLYACAQQEGKVVFYTSSSAATTTLLPAWQKTYPGVTMQVLVATADLPTKLKQEEDAGQHNFDVYGDTLGNLGRDQKYFQPIWTPRMGELRPFLSKPYYASYAGFLEGMVYNPNVVGSGDVPRTWKDLLLPKWTGKVYMGIDTGTAGFVGLLNRIYGPAFIDQLAKQVRVQQVSGRAIADQVIAGTIPIGINVSSSYHKTNYVDKGAPLRWVPLDPVPGFFQAASISKNAQHPCAAALLVDWLLAKDGAQPLWQSLGNVAPFKGAPLLPYNLVATSPPYTIPTKWNIYMTTNPSFFKGFKNYQAALASWNTIIQTKFLGG
jgi:ABC-type Fe3+ transport system substrate-binding protein